jgi:hypothetical protein
MQDKAKIQASARVRRRDKKILCSASLSAAFVFASVRRLQQWQLAWASLFFLSGSNPGRGANAALRCAASKKKTPGRLQTSWWRQVCF